MKWMEAKPYIRNEQIFNISIQLNLGFLALQRKLRLQPDILALQEGSEVFILCHLFFLKCIYIIPFLSTYIFSYIYRNLQDGSLYFFLFIYIFLWVIDGKMKDSASRHAPPISPKRASFCGFNHIIYLLDNSLYILML